MKESEDPIELAKRLGTYNQIDRSKQYEGQRYSSETLLRNDNLLFANVRRLEKEKFHHRLFLMTATAVLARAPEIWKWIAAFF